jgi:hypothetical protein
VVEVRALEIRDKGTFIPCLALRMTADNERQRYLLRRVGFEIEHPGIVLMVLNDQKATSDAYEWSSMGMGERTMPAAHLWIEEHFDELVDGSVVDVEFILGETTMPKRSEAYGG